MAEELGLSGRIAFAGECTEAQLRNLYSRSSAFVFPSHFEGFGMAIAEALAHGLPVVSTTGGAIPSTVSPQVGLLVPPGDEIALANAISTLLDRDSREPDVSRSSSGAEVRSRLSRSARRRGMELPAWDQQVRAFAEAVLALAP
jgi:glycosyltransferase involved in cell wall biosynthesis